jgi:hypothetical protein
LTPDDQWPKIRQLHLTGFDDSSGSGLIGVTFLETALLTLPWPREWALLNMQQS